MATTNAYAFGNHAPEAASRLGYLEAAYDPASIRFLDAVQLPPAAHCWEIGAGRGSLAGYLARRVRPGGGRVLATDIAPHVARDELGALEGVTVEGHDLRGPLPDDGPFDLIHARLVLGHLPVRREILSKLVDALKPGGWLVLEEFDSTVLQRALTAPGSEDAKIFERVVDFVQQLLRESGADPEWGYQLHSTMAETPLVDVDTCEYAASWRGGSPGCGLLSTNIVQLRTQLLAAGATPAELDRFHELMADPAFTATSFRLVSTRGRKPAESH